MKKKKGPSNNIVSQKILADFEQSKNDIDDIGINLKSINKGELLEDETFVKDIFSKKASKINTSQPVLSGTSKVQNVKTKSAAPKPNIQEVKKSTAPAKPIANSKKEENVSTAKLSKTVKKQELEQEDEEETTEQKEIKTKVKNLFGNTERGDTTKIKDDFLQREQTSSKLETKKTEQTLLNEKFLLNNNTSQTTNTSVGPSEQFKTLIDTVGKKAIQVIPFEKINNTGEILGEGGFGVVFKGVWSGINVAIKEMTISFEEFRVMDAEMTFMSKYRHPRLVGLYGICLQEIRASKLHCGMVMELMLMDLETLIFTNNERNLKLKLKIIKEIADGVVFLHDNGVIHRDLKPKNILLDNTLSAKISDLGIAKVLENKEKTENATMAFTARYASRESAIDNITTFKADIWSLGLLIYETLTHKRAWGLMNSTKILLQLNSKASPLEPGWEKEFPEDIVECVNKCLDYDIDRRISAKELVKLLEKIEFKPCAPLQEKLISKRATKI